MNHFSLLNEAFNTMVLRYQGIFEKYYPAFNSTGFTERNLTNNFVFGLERAFGSKTLAWFEMPTGPDYLGHLDAIAWNIELKYFACIEAKRFSNPKPKMRSLLKDLRRIANKNTFNEAGAAEESEKYVILLSDVWLENDEKRDIFKNWDGQYLRNQFEMLVKEEKFPPCICEGDELYRSFRFQNVKGPREGIKNYCVLFYAAKLSF